ncbi:MAG: RHS repeat domain-containing protein [Salibacteraceae bacterium]
MIYCFIPTTTTTAAAQHNGNIANITWKSASDGQRKGYGYHYDDFNRLTGAHYAENTTLGWNYHINRYSVSNISYDANGNILSLKRQGYLQSGSYGTMDDLQYSYAGNQLQAVNDLATQLGENDFRDNGTQALVEFNYDANGNMIQDQNKGIAVAYNYLDLPTKVDFGGGKEILNAYDAAGTKVRSTVKEPGNPDVVKTYTNGFVYQGSMLEFFSTDEGRVTPLSSGSQQFQYEYHYRDHLGNLRLSFADLDGNGSLDATSEILQEGHYYPFGLEMRYDAPPPALGVQHAFTYNGKELNESFALNWYDYGARNYDPQLGRWHSADPLAESYFPIAVFAYVANNPVSFYDPDGRSIGGYKDESGNLQWIYNESRDNISDENGVSWSKVTDNYFEFVDFSRKTGKPMTYKGKVKVATATVDDIFAGYNYIYKERLKDDPYNDINITVKLTDVFDFSNLEKGSGWTSNSTAGLRSTYIKKEFDLGNEGKLIIGFELSDVDNIEIIDIPRVMSPTTWKVLRKENGKYRFNQPNKVHPYPYGIGLVGEVFSILSGKQNSLFASHLAFEKGQTFLKSKKYLKNDF